MRLVLDTNVLVSAVFADGKTRRLLQLCIDGHHHPLASAETLQEFVEVIRRPKFGFTTEDQVHAALGAVVSVADVVEVRKQHNIIEADPADDMFIDVAVAGKAALGVEVLPARYEDAALVFDDAALGGAVRSWYGKLTALNRLIRETAKREGQPIQPYKPMDDVNLVLAIIAGLRNGDLPAMAHEVIWRQPFPNSNHRTMIAAIEDELGTTLAEGALRDAITPLLVESKALLDGSDASLTNEEAKERHQQLAERLVEAVQSIR